MAAIGTIGIQKALPDPVERHVVVARHHERPDRNLVHEMSRFLELARLGALGQITRDHHQVGFEVLDECEDASGQLG
jgi:hypothetical protein